MDLTRSVEDVRNYPLKRTSSLPAMLECEENAGPIGPEDNAKCHDEPKQYVGMLDIEEKVEDVIILEYETALFECKVLQDLKPTCNWRKDGKLLQSDDRITIKQDGAWYRLEIKRATPSDQGIYTIECRHKKSYISIKGHLYVAPRLVNDGVFYHKLKYCEEAGVLKRMDNVKVLRGETIVLKAEFRHESEVYIWIKNNDAIFNDQRTTMMSNAKSTTLVILNAKPSDAGVYFVVTKSVQGCFSSFADVLVGDSYEKKQPLPIIEQYLPDELTAVVGEEIRLIIKARTNSHTIIKWKKDNVEINTNGCKKVDYGNNYIGLTILNPEISSVGEYAVTLANDHRVVGTNTHITINIPPEPPLEIKLVRPLESAVACCGSKLSFDCSFDLKDPIHYFYVVWYIGPYKVERTNGLFNVICSGAEFILYIKKLEPSMAGEVICELRRAFPNRKSVMIKRAYANLVMVPLVFIQAAKQKPVLMSKLYYERDRYIISTRIETSGSDLLSVADIDETRPDSDPEFLLKIILCRLHKDGLDFMHITRGKNMSMTTHVTVYECSDTLCKVTVIQWGDSISSSNSWYGIEMAQADGSFVEAGITSSPHLEVESPPVDRMLIFCIRLVRPLNPDYDSKIYIVPPPEVVLRVATPLEVQSMESFAQEYSMTNEVIGEGAFGTVELIKGNDGAHYAAKIVKPKAGKQLDNVMREFHIMKKLRHPNLIQIINFYASIHVFVFVMEYYWGGELFDRIVGEEHLKEGDVVGYVKQICKGLEYMHSNSIVHLDLKPENIICSSPNSNQIKLIDFGLARNITDGSSRVFYGTRDYIAPEIIEFEPITTACDMWTLGVVTYTLLSGLNPFIGDSWTERSVNISSATYDYENYAFDEVSDLAKDFVNHLLIREPHRRMLASEALQHKWIHEGPPLGRKATHMNKMRQNLKSYLADYRLRWQRAGNVTIAVYRLRKKQREEALTSREPPKPEA